MYRASKSVAKSSDDFQPVRMTLHPGRILLRIADDRASRRDDREPHPSAGGLTKAIRQCIHIARVGRNKSLFDLRDDHPGQSQQLLLNLIEVESMEPVGGIRGCGRQRQQRNRQERRV